MHHPGPSRWLSRSARAQYCAPSSSNKGAERSGVKAGSHDAAVSHDASVRSMRPSLQLERPHNPRHQISS